MSDGAPPPHTPSLLLGGAGKRPAVQPAAMDDQRGKAARGEASSSGHSMLEEALSLHAGRPKVSPFFASPATAPAEPKHRLNPFGKQPAAAQPAEPPPPAASSESVACPDGLAGPCGQSFRDEGDWFNSLFPAPSAAPAQAGAAQSRRRLAGGAAGVAADAAGRRRSRRRRSARRRGRRRSSASCRGRRPPRRRPAPPPRRRRSSTATTNRSTASAGPPT